MSKTSPWFNYTTYMANKLAQLQETEPSFGWNYTKLAQAFADAGYGDEAGAERHFMEHGQNEDIAPNAFFNPDEYYYFKAAEFYGVEAKNVTELQAGNMRAAIKGAGMNAWEHYKAYGTGEGVNPSNSFDSKAYIQAKTDALNVAGGDTKWTPEMVEEAFKNAGMSALEHFMVYGGKGGIEVANGLTADGKIPAEFKVDEANKVSVANGETKSLTTEIDTFVGTSHNDLFIATLSAGTTGSTLNKGDSVDGGYGTDTLKVLAEGTTVSFNGMTIKNVEVVEVVAGSASATTIDVTGVTELEHLKFDVTKLDSAASAVTGINVDDMLTLKGLEGAATITYNNVLGSNDSASIALDGAAGTSSAISAAGVENLTLQTTGGRSALGTLTVTDLKTLTIAAGTDLSITTLAGGTGVETLTVSGVGAVGISANASVANALKTVTTGDGDVTLDLSAQDKDTTLTFTGGKGDDTLKLKKAMLTSADKLSGGAEGRDTLVVAGTGTFASAADFAGINAVTDFEVLGFGATATVTMSNITTKFDTYEVYGASGGYAATFNKIANNTKFEVDFAGATTANAFGVLSLSADKVASTVDLTLDNNLNAGVTVGGISLSNIGSFNLHSEGGAAVTNTITALTLTQNMKVAIDGDASVVVTASLGTSSAVEVDASGLTGKATLTYTTGSGDETVTGTANNDTFNKGANTGFDTFHGGKGADTYALTTATGASQALTLTFDDGDSVGTGGTIKLADMLVLSTKTWDVVTGFANSATATADSKLTLDTDQSATSFANVTDAAAFEAAGGFGKVSVENAHDFYVVLAANTSVAVVFQDTNGNKVIDSDDFMITIAGTTGFASDDFAITDGNLVVN